MNSTHDKVSFTVTTIYTAIKATLITKTQWRNLNAFVLNATDVAYQLKKEELYLVIVHCVNLRRIVWKLESVT